MEKEKRYKPTALAKKFGLKTITVAQRFSSPYAKDRWGVVVRKRKDGSFERYVPESKLYLWEGNPSYVGRPTFRQK